jgi:hypothetical protein
MVTQEKEPLICQRPLSHASILLKLSKMKNMVGDGNVQIKELSAHIDTCFQQGIKSQARKTEKHKRNRERKKLPVIEQLKKLLRNREML